jgi:hypothetical protein
MSEFLAIRAVVEPTEGNELPKRTLEARIDGLTAWRKGEPRESQQVQSEKVKSVLVRQDRVGWRALFEGRWIAALEEGHRPDRHNRSQGKRWLVEILKKLLGIAWDQWTQRNEAVHKADQGQVEEEVNQAVRTLGCQASQIAGLEEFVKVPEQTRLYPCR